MKMDNLGNGANYAFFNDRTYTRPKVPTLYSALTTGEMATDVGVYGSNTNAFVLGQGEVVEIVLNSLDPGKHPFHLHGHEFQAVVRSEEEAGVYVNNETMPEFPMRRDTFMVRPNGNIVLRFRADNPGNASHSPPAPPVSLSDRLSHILPLVLRPKAPTLSPPPLSPPTPPRKKNQFINSTLRKQASGSSTATSNGTSPPASWPP